MQANLEALNKAVELINVGVSLHEIGKAVNEIAKKNGFNTIHNLSGHQIGKNDLHCGLSIPNYGNLNNSKIKEDCEFAIEPFFTKGEPKVKSIGSSNHMHLAKDKPIRDPIAKKVLIYIKENFPELPFSKRWLLKDIKGNEKGFDLRKVNYAVKILKDHGILYEYDCLVSNDGSIITQFEDSVVFDKDKKIVLTRL
jgi:methionyl aminopeptidase